MFSSTLVGMSDSRITQKVMDVRLGTKWQYLILDFESDLDPGICFDFL